MFAFIYLLATSSAIAIQVPWDQPVALRDPAQLPPADRRTGKERSAVPRGNPGDWVTTDDYPQTALVKEHSGIVVFRLQIDRTGRVSSCELLESSGHADLDSATCTLISQRAEFSPALDRRGRAIAGTYTNRVRWQIPQHDFVRMAIMTDSFPRNPQTVDFNQLAIDDNDYPQEAISAGQEGETEFQLGISEAGIVDKCEITSTSGFAALDGRSCALAEKWKFIPALDVEGRPTRGRVRHTIFWELPKKDTSTSPEPPFVPANPFEKEGAIALTVDINETGKVANCAVQQDGLVSLLGQGPDLSAELCKFMDQAQFKAFADPTGQPVAKRVVATFSIKHDEVPSIPPAK